MCDANSQTTDDEIVIIRISRSELAERGRRGGKRRHAVHGSAEHMQRARRAFESRFASDDERRAYFARIGKLGAEARRARKEAADAAA